MFLRKLGYGFNENTKWMYWNGIQSYVNAFETKLQRYFGRRKIANLFTLAFTTEMNVA